MIGMTTLGRTILVTAVGAVLGSIAGGGPADSASLSMTSAQTPDPTQAQTRHAERPAGDASRGKALFESNACFDCHRVGDRGSRFGPDLSDVGDRRLPDRLRLALVEPDKEVVPENRFARVVTKDGTKILGRLLNQDSTSVQLMTQKEELKTYLRGNLREYTIVDTGLMPSSQGKLTDQQVDDVVAYLSSLKGS